MKKLLIVSFVFMLVSVSAHAGIPACEEFKTTTQLYRAADLGHGKIDEYIVMYAGVLEGERKQAILEALRSIKANIYSYVVYCSQFISQ